MVNDNSKKQHILGIVMLAFASVFWGSGFVLNAQLTQDGASFANMPGLLNAIRFGVATLCLLAVFNKRIVFNRRVLLYGAVGGALLFGGFLLQTVALKYTTPAHNGFFTAAYVIFVPFIAWIARKKRPNWVMLLGAAVAVAGLFVLNIKKETLPPDAWKGDLITLACALCFALHIVWLDVCLATNKTDSVQLTFWQVAFAAIFLIVYSLIVENKYVFTMEFDFAYCWWRLAIMTIGGTAFAYFAQTYAQKHVSSTETSILMGCESPFGAILSLIVGLDVFSWTIPVGGGLVVAAVVLVEIVPNLITKHKSNEAMTAEVSQETNQENFD